MKVQNMTSNSGNSVPNQFIIDSKEGQYFQSCGSVIALKKNNGSVVLDKTYWDYSATTGRYRNKFLGMGIADTRKAIEAGTIKLVNLN